MRGGRIFWGQIAAVFAIILLRIWAATQWTAWRLEFQPQLGQPGQATTQDKQLALLNAAADRRDLPIYAAVLVPRRTSLPPIP